MEGIYYLTDERNQKRILQIDLDKFDREYLEDLLDGLVAYSRRNEETVSFEQVLQEMREEGKLDE